MTKLLAMYFSPTAFAIFATITLGTVSSARRVDTPFGAAIEGVSHIAGSNFVLSDVRNGRLMWYDQETDLFATISQAPIGSTFHGIRYHTPSGYVFAAGSGPLFAAVNNMELNQSDNMYNFSYPVAQPAMHVYSLTTGQPIVTCSAPEGANLINDVAVDRVGEFAYFTDSMRATLYRMHISAFPECNIDTIALPRKQFGGNGFYAAGLEMFAGGLLITSFNGRTVWFHDLTSVSTYRVTGPAMRFGNQVGVRVVANKCMLTADYSKNLIHVYRLRKKSGNGKVVARWKYSLGDGHLSQPTTFDVIGRNIVVANFNNTELGNNGRMYLTVKLINEINDLC